MRNDDGLDERFSRCVAGCTTIARIPESRTVAGGAARRSKMYYCSSYIVGATITHVGIPFDLPNSFNAAHAWHADIHRDDIDIKVLVFCCR